MPTGDPFRPRDWHEFIGQERLKEGLQVRINAAIKDDRRLGHVLLVSPPGAGKTSLARVIAQKSGVPFESVTMPITSKTLHTLVAQLSYSVLFFDELHRCPPRQQEELLPLLSEGAILTNSGKRLENDTLTIIGATTEPQLLIAPLTDRFEIRPSFEAYTDEQLCRIVLAMAAKAKTSISVDAAMSLGRASNGMPRRARELVLAYRDAIQGGLEPVTVEAVLALCETAADGLTWQHERYLSTLDAVNGTAGLRTLCSLLRLNEAVVNEIERVLILRGFLTLEERGRTLTRDGYARLKAVAA